MLARPGDRAVLGPSTDGGYYLLGIKQAHRRLFDDIDWSTERVARQTLERASEIGLDVHCLPAWYDVDDSQALRQLHAELFEGGSLDPALTPFHAPNTAALMDDLLATADLRHPARTVTQGIGKARVMTAVAGQPAVDPRRYFESVDARRSQKAERLPVCVYLETTNRCNLLCTTCPRTYAELEPPADMSWSLFTSIVDQIPHLERAVMHGVGEPMLVKNLPKMVRYLKDRGTYVLFNTNGTVLNDKNGRALIDAGLDELRVSLDASNAESFLAIRGADFFNRILRNVRRFRELQVREGHERPRVSAWLTGLKETITELPAFVRVAADIGVKEVYLQRLVYFDNDAIGNARPDQALFERMTAEEAVYIDEAAALARSLGMTFSASGAASEPGMSLTPRERRLALVAVPAAVVGDVFHRQRPRAAVLHRAVLAARLRELHARRRHPADAARNLERARLFFVPRSAVVRPAADGLRQLRPALEFFRSCGSPSPFPR